MTGVAAPVGQSTTPALKERPGGPRRLGWQQLSLPLLWLLLILIFGALHPDTFLTASTVRSIASQQAITVIMALALVLPLAANTFDASIGGVMGISIIVVAFLQARAELSPLVAVVLTMVVALGIGLVNGLVIVRFQVNSFIATLGMLSILTAGIQWVSEGRDIIQGISPDFTQLARWSFLTVSAPFYYMLVVAFVLWYVLRHRQTGRYLYATGANREAARLAGVRTGRLVMLSLCASALLAGFAGLLFTATTGAGSVTAGPPYLLPAFAAAFLGATQSRSGIVNVPGTVVAVFMLATGVHGLRLSGAEFWIADAFNGVALIVAVALSHRINRQRS